MNHIAPSSAPRHLRIVAQVLGDKLGINVLFSNKADTAFTDGQTIVIPSPASVSEVELDVVLGYLCHEAAHLKSTDFTLDRGSEIEAFLGNILEDIRIERVMAQTWPGTRKMIDYFIDILLSRNLFFPIPSGDLDKLGLFERACGAICLVGRVVHRNQISLKNHSGSWDLLFKEVVSQDVYQKVFDLVSESTSLNSSTAVTIDVSKKIADLLKLNLFQPSEPGEQSGSGAGSQPSEPGEQSGSGAGSQPSEPGEQSGSGAGSQPSEPGEQSGSGGGSSVPYVGDFFEELKKLANHTQILNGLLGIESHQNDIEPLEIKPCCGGMDCKKSESIAITSSSDRNIGSSLQNDVRPLVGGLSRKLDFLLQSKTFSEFYISRSGSKLSSGHLHRTAICNGLVFRNETEREEIDTAITIVIDQSGSMAFPRNHLTAVAATALEQVLSRNLCKVKVAGFNSLRCCIYKDWDQRVSTSSDWLSLVATSTTPLSGALTHLLPDLALRDETRKICFIITDGYPDNADEVHSQLYESLTLGIETRFVLIAPRNGEQMVDRFRQKVVRGLNVAVSSASSSASLAPAIFEALASAL